MNEVATSVGSIPTGAVYAGDLRTGSGDVLVQGATGRAATGLKYDQGRLFVSGAGTGPNDCNGTATQTAYYATAVPQTFGSTGGRSFATNGSNTTWQVYAAAAPTEPFTAPATPVQ